MYEYGKCSFCERERDLYHIRGRLACLKCQIEFLWDFIEGTRRIIENLESVRSVAQSPKEHTPPVNMFRPSGDD